jgi:hypothetical protein
MTPGDGHHPHMTRGSSIASSAAVRLLDVHKRIDLFPGRDAVGGLRGSFTRPLTRGCFLCRPYRAVLDG